MWNWLCAGSIGLGWAHDAISLACHIFMHSREYILYIQYILIHLNYLGLFWLFLSPSLSSVYVSLLVRHPNANLLRLRTLSVPGHPLLPILLPDMSGSMIRRPNRTSLRTFLDEAFILNAKSSCRISLTLTFLLSFIIGNRSHYVTFRSHVHRMMRMLEVLALPMLMRCLLNAFTLCHSWKEWGVVLVMRILIVKGRVSLRGFC